MSMVIHNTILPATPYHSGSAFLPHIRLATDLLQTISPDMT